MGIGVQHENARTHFRTLNRCSLRASRTIFTTSLLWMMPSPIPPIQESPQTACCVVPCRARWCGSLPRYRGQVFRGPGVACGIGEAQHLHEATSAHACGFGVFSVQISCWVHLDPKSRKVNYSREENTKGACSIDQLRPTLTKLCSTGVLADRATRNTHGSH